jgi:hypothetical protein
MNHGHGYDFFFFQKIPRILTLVPELDFFLYILLKHT